MKKIILSESQFKKLFETNKIRRVKDNEYPKKQYNPKNDKVFSKLKDDDKIVLYNLKVIEEVGKVLKSRNGGCLSAFIKNHFKQSWEINSFEVLEIILEAITYL